MTAGLGGPAGGGNGRGPKRVLRTGLALVHENEIVYPSPGSEALAALALDDANADIELHFPIIIEVVDSAAEARAEAAADDAVREGQRRLLRALRSG